MTSLSPHKCCYDPDLPASGSFCPFSALPPALNSHQTHKDFGSLVFFPPCCSSFAACTKKKSSKPWHHSLCLSKLMTIIYRCVFSGCSLFPCWPHSWLDPASLVPDLDLALLADICHLKRPYICFLWQHSVLILSAHWTGLCSQPMLEGIHLGCYPIPLFTHYFHLLRWCPFNEQRVVRQRQALFKQGFVKP